MKVRAFLSLIITAALALFVPVSVAAQSPSTYTSISVTDVISGAPVVGSTFTTDVQVSITNHATPEVGVMGVEIWMPFDSSVVTVDDFDDNPANGAQVEIKNDFFDGSLVIGANQTIIGPMPPTAPEHCVAAGACVHIAVSHTGGSGPVTNKTGAVATIVWAALAAGSPGIGIAVVPPGLPPGSVLSDANGQLIPINSTFVPNITVSGAGAIVGAVKRQGAQADRAGVQVVGVAADNGTVATATTGADGGFRLEIPAQGTYTVNASYPGYLQSQKSAVYVAGTTVDIGPTTLMGGDVNADNCINILDLTIAAGNFTRCGPTAWGS